MADLVVGRTSFSSPPLQVAGGEEQPRRGRLCWTAATGLAAACPWPLMLRRQKGKKTLWWVSGFGGGSVEREMRDDGDRNQSALVGRQTRNGQLWRGRLALFSKG